MERKMGITSHRPGKTIPSLHDKNLYPNIYRKIAYDATLYINSRKIFQRFETCKDTYLWDRKDYQSMQY